MVLTPSSQPPSRPDEFDRDVETSRPYSPALSTRATSELLSGVRRGFRRLGSSREDPTRLPLQFRHPPYAPPTDSRRGSALFEDFVYSDSSSFAPKQQNARKLSLQHSLDKPLPDPPAFLSPASPPSPAHLVTDDFPGGVQGFEQDFDYEAEDDEAKDDETDGDRDGRASTRPNANAMDASLLYGADGQGGDMNGGLPHRQLGDEGRDTTTPKSNGSSSAGPSPSAAQGKVPAPSANLSGLVCNVHRTTGREPRPLVGATTTVLGDKLYVFGGRILSRSRPAPLTADMYELDLVRRHWTKLEMTGDVPPPRYFHSMCPLGDTKLVCYGGMSPAPARSDIPAPDQQPEVAVMSDIHIFDVPTMSWTHVPSQDAPQGRYAHCACVLPSAAVFSSHRAPLSALQHNPPSAANPNEGRIGISIDGTGGAEMVVVGGQDGANHYIEQISVFNLRSLKWTSTQSLGKSCGAYRSVVAPLPPAVSARLGRGYPAGPVRTEGGISLEAREPGSSMLIYSNYNFLDVKLELQIRSSDGTLTERGMSGAHSPPGLRFPNGGVVETHFVVSGTYLTSSKQEYALWALDLRSLTWTRIDAGGNVFGQGSWNRGVLWGRRNTFVILGNRKRSLVDDYNHRRINFTNVCMVELEAFGFYDNPRKAAPMSGFVSASSPYAGLNLSVARKAGSTAGGRFHSRASEELGEKILAMRELSDMDIMCIGGERIPVNSRIVARRWGPYFVQLLREGTATQDGSDAATLRSTMAAPLLSRGGPTSLRSGAESPMSIGGVFSPGSSTKQPPSMAATSVSGGAGLLAPPGASVSMGAGGVASAVDASMVSAAPTPRTLAPGSRPRCLYLPHTYLTVQALLHFIYTSALPAPSSPLCTPQILCSLLQIARPYRIDGLLEAVVGRLHSLLDARNAAAVFNTTAMAAGGGRGIDGSLNPNFFVAAVELMAGGELATDNGAGGGGSGRSSGGAAVPASGGDVHGLANRKTGLKINTLVGGQPPGGGRPPSEELSATTSTSESEWSADDWDRTGPDGGDPGEVWWGELSSVIGLQKRGLRGLMEGRRMRERTGTGTGTGLGLGAGVGYGMARVGLGIGGP